MSPHTITRLLAAGLAFLLLLSCNSTQTRNLKISEVGKRNVELYLDEPTNKSLTTGGSFVLSVATSDGTRKAVDLGLLRAPIRGGEFAMIFAESGYQGPPVAADFTGGQTGIVPGIRVASDFFGDIDMQASELRLRGSRNRVSSLIVIIPQFTRDDLNDVVRFGTPVPDRPRSGGTFRDTGALANPAGSTSAQRHWGASAPIDTDSEDDWVIVWPPNWGVRTP
jgi:hypothetical protein